METKIKYKVTDLVVYVKTKNKNKITDLDTLIVVYGKRLNVNGVHIPNMKSLFLTLRVRMGHLYSPENGYDLPIPVF